MSTQSSNALSNKGNEPKKIAGCMTAIFQLFDHKQVPGRRQLTGKGHKTDRGHASISCRQEAECNEFYSLEKNLGTTMQESPRSSMASSRISSSTTASSPQEKPKYTDQKLLSGSSQKSSSPSSSNIKSLGFKGSLYRDVQRERAKDGLNRNKVLQPIDSPRPKHLIKSEEVEESLNILIKLKEMSQNSHGVCYSPRFSLDREEVMLTSTIKQREHRRLSLGSMEDCLRYDSPDKSTNQRTFKSPNLIIKDEEGNEYYPGIIAKLMGLQATTSSKIESFKCQTNRRAAQECKLDKPMQSPRNNPKSPRSINLDTKSACNARLKPEHIPQKITKQYCDVDMKQKIESVYHVMQQKLQIQCDSKEEEDLKWEILRNKKNGDQHLRSVNSMSSQLTQGNYKSNKARTIERDSKSQVAITKPASKSTHICSSPIAQLEGTSGLRRIRTSDSAIRMEALNATCDGEQTPTPKKANSRSISSTKDASGRAASNSTGPRLQKKMPDAEGKSITAVPNYDSKKIKIQPGNGQPSETISHGRTRIKPSNVQYNGHQNLAVRLHDQIEQANSTKEKKHRLLQEGNERSKAKIAFDTASTTKYKRHEIKHKEDIPQKELLKFAPQLSSPSSVLDASLYQDDLPLSPLSVSSLSKAEDENIPSDLNLNTKHHHVNLQSSPSSLRTAAQKPERIDPIVHKSMAFQRANDEPPPADEIPLFLGINDQDSKYIAEMLASNILGKDPYMTLTRQAKKPEEPSENRPKDSRQMLHKQLVFDVVNEILAQKKDNLSSCSQHLQHKRTKAQHLFKELCSEIKCLQSSRDRSLLNENTIATTDLLQRSKAWDDFGSEVPVVVLEIERLIYTDMINEIVTSAPDLQETKQKNHRRHIII